MSQHLLESFVFPEYLRNQTWAPVTTAEDDAEARAEGRWAPFYTHWSPDDIDADFQVNSDDRHITAAALWLHPLLGDAAIAAFGALLPWRDGVDKRVHAAGARLVEMAPGAAPDLHLVINGSAKLVVSRGGVKQQVGLVGPGQWIGLPQLVRAHDRRTGEHAWPADDGLSVEIVALEPMLTQTIPGEAALGLMAEQEDVRRFARNIVAVRFARRAEVRRLFAENPMARLLSTLDMEYLLQLGVVKRARTGDSNTLYMRAGAPSHRVAMVLRGAAVGVLVDVPGMQPGDVRLAGGFPVGSLVGHEALVMAEEKHDWALTFAGEEPDDAPLPPLPREAPRGTQVALAPGTEVLEFYWYAVRWALDGHPAVWDRVVRIASGHLGDLLEPLPERVTFLAAREKLGLTSLAYGTAVSLARHTGSTVWVVDLQGPESFEATWRPAGFSLEETGEAGTRTAMGRLRAPDRRASVRYVRLVAPPDKRGWLPGVEVVWPRDPSNVGDVLSLVQSVESWVAQHVRYVVLASASEKTTPQLADRLGAGSDSTFFVCDDTTARYAFSEWEPPSLTWVFRMTPEYVAREAERSRKVRLDWTWSRGFDRLPEGIKGSLAGAIGFRPGEALDDESVHAIRRMVRVPDDAEGARLAKAGRFDQLSSSQPLGPLARACERLGRVVRRCTVGIALGGGGAWGFSHVALLENLEKTGVPIDYIAGASIGSTIAGLYVGGGLPLLNRVLDENSVEDDAGPLALLAIAGRRMPRAVMLGMIHSGSIERFINESIRRHLAQGGAAAATPSLATTEIPFYPVATNLDDHNEVSELRASIGWGVRMSGSLPPMYAPLKRRGKAIVDGGIVANVPSRVVRAMGAHFVIAANVVPTTLDEPHEQTTAQRVVRRVLGRVESAMRSACVMVWKAGNDQGSLSADLTLNLEPTNANMMDFWRGRRISDAVRDKHFSGERLSSVRKRWDEFCGPHGRGAA